MTDPGRPSGSITGVRLDGYWYDSADGKYHSGIQTSDNKYIKLRPKPTSDEAEKEYRAAFAKLRPGEALQSVLFHQPVYPKQGSGGSSTGGGVAILPPATDGNSTADLPPAQNPASHRHVPSQKRNRSPQRRRQSPASSSSTAPSPPNPPPSAPSKPVQSSPSAASQLLPRGPAAHTPLHVQRAVPPSSAPPGPHPPGIIAPIPQPPLQAAAISSHVKPPPPSRPPPSLTPPLIMTGNSDPSPRKNEMQPQAPPPVAASPPPPPVTRPLARSTSTSTQPSTTATTAPVGKPTGDSCSCEVCLTLGKRKEIFDHFLECRRPKFCAVPLCEKLRECGTDDLYEAFAKLERDAHLAAKPFHRNTKRRRLDENFPPIPDDFRKSDEDYFGKDHISPETSVILTGTYNALDETISGSWMNAHVNGANKNQRRLPFAFTSAYDDILDHQNTKPCEVCASSEDPTPGNPYIVCDKCDKPFHIHCVNLSAIPQESFFCRGCQNLMSRLGTTIPPTRRYKGSFQFNDKLNIKDMHDEAYVVFDYANPPAANSKALARISGEGNNQFGKYTIQGLLMRPEGSHYPIQISKVWTIAPH